MRVSANKEAICRLLSLSGGDVYLSIQDVRGIEYTWQRPASVSGAERARTHRVL